MGTVEDNIGLKKKFSESKSLNMDVLHFTQLSITIEKCQKLSPHKG